MPFDAAQGCVVVTGQSGQAERRTSDVLGTPIDVISWTDSLARISLWASRKETRVICICNSHSLVTAKKDADFRRVVEAADMATPDGAPVAFMLRRAGFPSQERINGPDLMWRHCEMAAQSGPAIYLYGGSPETLALLQSRLLAAFPSLRIAGACSPPYRELSQAEDEQIVSDINSSGAEVVWVSLGCPKQEKWMDEHRGRISAVMVGVGAAFDYHAGTIKRAPLWMQRNGLEWLHRLASEPRRLWRRYMETNLLFIWYATRQLIRWR